LARRKNLHRSFARVSPVFVALGVALFLCALSAFAAEASGAGGTTWRRHAASAQYAKAQDQRDSLNEKPANKRTLAEYKQVVSSYHRVYLITPRAPEVPDALLAEAGLYIEMGDRFGRSYYQSAVDSYQFLIHEYPASKHGQEALLRVAQVQKDQLADPALATKTYEEFLKKYPRSPRRRDAQEALAELALLQMSEQAGSSKSAAAGPKASAKTPDTTEASRALPGEADSAPAASPGGIPHVTRISTSASTDSARVTIDLDDAAQYSSARIRNPDRIFFDIHAAKLTPELAKAKIHVEGDMLTAVRVAQNQAGVVRVVLDVNEVKDYTANLLNHPPELVIDLYRDTAPVRSAKSKNGRVPSDDDDASVDAAAVVPGGKPSATGGSAAANTASVTDRGNAVGGVTPGGTTLGNTGPRAKSLKAVSTNPATAGKSAAADKPDLIRPPTAPQPTRDGQATLTRALGLKIGRIVIDPGHGGHDTGTIGPTGLMEKDLCLDIALRLGKIVQQRLPGADVVYTRSDDTFVPLEDRTRIANEAKADLFISIHANSSHDHAARGVETYYLNLKGSPDAMEVAARENASSQEGVHDLEDMVKKIARNEKIDESREFAADIQESLAKRIQKNSKPVKNRGVRKAPFVVLIGADMPSILTEISFLSNPSDEQLLKKPDHRQRVAEGLYQGVASYLQNLNSVTVNLPKLPLKPPGRATAMVSVEQSRNPQ
jgi:N-acetylmuramoyl-L-alanine amidase